MFANVKKYFLHHFYELDFEYQSAKTDTYLKS